MNQAHHIYYAATDVTGGRAQVVLWAVGSGCKYIWSSAYSLTVYLLLCGPVPSHGPVAVCGPGVEDPWFPGLVCHSSIVACTELQFFTEPKQIIFAGKITGCLIVLGSVQFSCSVVSDSLWPHESQHTRPPCPSPSPGVYSNSRWIWVHFLAFFKIHICAGTQIHTLYTPPYTYFLVKNNCNSWGIHP